MNIWECKIGGFEGGLPMGADSPMRRAVADAYFKLTGEWPKFNFSGWGGSLTETEKQVVDHKEVTR